ncbi:hypothetical protein NKG94_05920 [Micromonospora sp. M12]
MTDALSPAEEAVAIADRLGDRRAQAEGLHAYGEALRTAARMLPGSRWSGRWDFRRTR